MRSYSQLSKFDLLLDFDLDLSSRPFRNESLPDLNVAINPLKFHHSTTKIVVRKLFTNRQTKKQRNKQTSKQTNKQINKQANKQTNKQTNKQGLKQYLPNFDGGGNNNNNNS